MPASKKPRKKYRQKYSATVNPLAYVLSGFKPLTTDSKTKLGTINHGSMVALVNGTAVRNDWDNICVLINMSVVMSEMVFQEAYLDDLKLAMLAHAHCGRRLNTHGKFGYSGEEINAVNFAMEIHDQQLEQITVAELEATHKEVARRIRQGNIAHSIKEQTNEQSSNVAESAAAS